MYPSHVKGMANINTPKKGSTTAAPSTANSLAALRGKIFAPMVAIPKSTEPMSRRMREWCVPRGQDHADLFRYWVGLLG